MGGGGGGCSLTVETHISVRGCIGWGGCDIDCSLREEHGANVCSRVYWERARLILTLSCAAVRANSIACVCACERALVCTFYRAAAAAAVCVWRRRNCIIIALCGCTKRRRRTLP